MRFLFRMIIVAIAFMLAFRFVKGVIVDNYWFQIIVALIYGFLNAAIRPFAAYYHHRFSWVFLGVVGLILNAVLFWLMAQGAWEALGIYISYGAALFIGLFIWLVGLVCNHFINPNTKIKRR